MRSQLSRILAPDMKFSLSTALREGHLCLNNRCQEMATTPCRSTKAIKAKEQPATLAPAIPDSAIWQSQMMMVSRKMVGFVN